MIESSSIKSWIKQNDVRLIARQKGWPYIMSWIHRITGVLLVGYALLHIKTLSLLSNTEIYDSQMALYSGPFFVFLEWVLAIPVMLHAINGGCLILYESFGYRKNNFLIKTVFIFSGIFVLILAVLTLMGNQVMSPIAFWLPILVVSISVCWGLIFRMVSAGLPLTFILQRVTGAFLLVMIPAHLFFMHLSPEVSKSSAVVISRMKLLLIGVIDTALVVAIFYHSAHGIISIVSDYVAKGKIRTTIVSVVVLIALIFAYTGLHLNWSL